MGTKSNKSSGTQHNPKGVTQGVTLVDPKSGNPVDTVTDSNGVRRIAVDGNFVAQNVQAFVELEHTEDSVAIGDENSGNMLKIESDGSINVNIESDATDGDNIGLKVQERNLSPDDTKYTKRVTAKTGSSDTDTTSLDVSLHDHSGNQFTETNQFPTNSSIRDGSNPAIKAIVDSDNNLHIESHGNKPNGTDVVQKLSELGETAVDGTYDATNNTNPANIGIVTQQRNIAADDIRQIEKPTSIRGSTDTTDVSLDTSLHDGDGNRVTLGQKPMTNSLPVVLSSDQTGINTFQDKTVYGTIANADTTTAIEIVCNGCATVNIQLTGTWGGITRFEGTGVASPAPTDWFPVDAYNKNGSTFVNNTTANNDFEVNCSALTKIRVIRTTATSGTLEVHLTASAALAVVRAVSRSANNFIVAAVQSGIWNVSLFDATRRTYSAASIFTAANAATDIFTITGSATTTVRIIRLSISATKTSAGTADVVLLKRSTDNTGGTSATLTNVAHDSADAVATNTVRSYTANPTTLGTLIGNMQVDKLHVIETTKMTSQHTLEWDWTASQGKAPVLRGVAQILAVNLAGQTLAGNSFAIDVTWSEE